MSIVGIARTDGFRTREELIDGLTKRHPVNARFLEGMLPTIDAIFNNVPGHLRGTMISLTVDAFRRQAILDATSPLTSRRSRASRRVRRATMASGEVSRAS